MPVKPLKLRSPRKRMSIHQRILIKSGALERGEGHAPPQIRSQAQAYIQHRKGDVSQICPHRFITHEQIVTTLPSERASPVVRN